MKKVIDVSNWNGSVNWSKVKSSGVEGAILKIINKSRNADGHFYENAKACESIGMPWGVYNYTYAVTVAQAKKDMNLICDMLDKLSRKHFKLGVWFDLEDKCQAALSKDSVTEIVNAAQEVVERRGYNFGVYVGEYYYNDHINAKKVKCKNWWVPRYYKGYEAMNVATDPNGAYKPTKITSNLFGWQYTSTCKIPGLSDTFDMSVWYREFSGTTATNAKPVSAEKESYSGKFPALPTCSFYRIGDGITWNVIYKDEIRKIQSFLNWAIGAGLEADGKYGSKTEAAVKKFQKVAGCAQDGKWGKQTLSAAIQFRR